MSTPSSVPIEPSSPSIQPPLVVALREGRPALGGPVLWGLLVALGSLQWTSRVGPASVALLLGALLGGLASLAVWSWVRSRIPTTLSISARSVSLMRGPRTLTRLSLLELQEVNQFESPAGPVLLLADAREQILLGRVQLVRGTDFGRACEAIVQRVAEIDPTGALGRRVAHTGRVHSQLATRPVVLVWWLAGALALGSVWAFWHQREDLSLPFLTERVGGLSLPLLLQGEWFRLASHAFVHASPTHLLLGIGGLFWIGAAVERLVGWERTLVGFTVGVLCGALGHVAALGPLPGTGAGSGLFGLVGLMLAVSTTGRSRLPPALRPRSAFWVTALMLGFLYPGVSVDGRWLPTTTTVTHLAAAAGGALLGLVMTWRMTLPTTADECRFWRPAAIQAVVILAVGLGAVVWHPRLDHPDDARWIHRAWQSMPEAPALAQVHNAIAYDLLTRSLTPSAESIDIGTDLAQRAADSTGYDAPDIVDTLAVARYLAGDTPEAERLLTLALSTLDAATDEDRASLRKIIERHLRDVRAGRPLGPDPGP